MKPQRLALTSNATSSRNAWYCLLLILASQAHSFLMLHQPSSNIRHFSVLDDIEGESSDDVNFDGFNPLSYKPAKSNSAYSYSGTQISLRKTRMQDLNAALLDVTGDEEQTKRILEDYKDFLLEQLEDSEAVLDPDSVYTPSMSRDERYQAYRDAMDQRLEVVRNPQAKWVLQSMRDFVLSFE